VAHEKLREDVSTEVIRLVAEVQRIPAEKISLKRDLAIYGFDSISFTELSNALNKTYALSLMPTLFFGISDLAALVDHLIANHRALLLKKHGRDTPAPRPRPSCMAATAAPAPGVVREPEPAPTVDPDAIAIIGIGGKFPGAQSPDELWRHIEANRDLITEVP